MLLILTRLVSPTFASRSAASNALSSVEASPRPAVRKNLVATGPNMYTPNISAKPFTGPGFSSHMSEMPPARGVRFLLSVRLGERLQITVTGLFLQPG